MLINADWKALEVLCAFYLSKDKVGYKELLDNVDIHEENRAVFGLPTRLISKKFKFRLIYGGSAFAYANDPEFADVSRSNEFWQEVIDKYYRKYSGLKRWHDALMTEAMMTGHVKMLTGRVYKFQKDPRGNWPRTTILNYPVQGFGADLMVLARLLVRRELNAKYGKESDRWLASTVHDSVVLDVPNEKVQEVASVLFSCWDFIPGTFERIYGLKFDLPAKVEVSYGPNLKQLTEIKPNAN